MDVYAMLEILILDWYGSYSEDQRLKEVSCTSTSNGIESNRS